MKRPNFDDDDDFRKFNFRNFFSLDNKRISDETDSKFRRWRYFDEFGLLRSLPVAIAMKLFQALIYKSVLTVLCQNHL